jgi:hypothetical protein
MAFFAGASGVAIYGGSFVNNAGSGNVTINDSSQHTNNINSNNRSTNNMTNSHNDNSTRISEQFDGFTLNDRLMTCCKAVMERYHPYRGLLDPQVGLYV